MSEIITVVLDLAKNVFQVHGADGSGRAVLRKKLRRDQVLDFFGQLRPCVVAMEACGGAHFWGREIVPQGAANAARLIAVVEDPDTDLPVDAVTTLKVLVAALTHMEAEIGKLDTEIARRAKKNEVARRLMTVPGIGPLIATAIAVLAPPPETFRKARDFAAWLGLTPRQHSTGGKHRLGATTKMGERSLRRLLIIGANSVIIKRYVHAAARPGTWLGGMLTRKPPMRVRVALANKMARIVWALMARGGGYRSPAAAA
jgi:transposase